MKDAILEFQPWTNDDIARSFWAATPALGAIVTYPTCAMLNEEEWSSWSRCLVTPKDGAILSTYVATAVFLNTFSGTVQLRHSDNQSVVLLDNLGIKPPKANIPLLDTLVDAVYSRPSLWETLPFTTRQAPKYKANTLFDVYTSIANTFGNSIRNWRNAVRSASSTYEPDETVEDAQAQLEFAGRFQRAIWLREREPTNIPPIPASILYDLEAAFKAAGIFSQPWEK